MSKENQAILVKFWKDKYQVAVNRVVELEDLLFTMGAMEERMPCFCCGYSGPGYFQPEVHKCAERHHRLKEVRDDE